MVTCKAISIPRNHASILDFWRCQNLWDLIRVSLSDGHFTGKGFKVIQGFRGQLAYETELNNYSIDSPKSVDFANESLLVLDMGMHSSGGFSIKVSSVVEDDDTVVVSIQSEEPGENCLVSLALSNPYQFVKIASKKRILIRELSPIKTVCN